MAKETEKDKECKIDLDELSKQYNELAGKHKLPEFDELAQEFDIEKASEKPGKYLLRNMRRTMNDKISAYLHLFETFMNPGNAPMFILSMLKNATINDKKDIEEIYKKLAKIEIITIKLDTIYSEENEARFIRDSFDKWQNMKDKIMELIEKFDSSFDVNSKAVARGYFG